MFEPSIVSQASDDPFKKEAGADYANDDGPEIPDENNEPKPAEDFQNKQESENTKSEAEGGSQKYEYGSLPNFLIFVVDDLGSQDLGCFGNKTIPTPHLDKMREEGALLEHHLSAAPICTPSRVAFLTGRYAKRMGLAQGKGDPPVIIYVSGKAGLPDDEQTFADVVKEKGYSTGIVGKWHVGWDESTWNDQKHGPRGHGFDYNFGLPYTLVKQFASEDSFWTMKRITKNDFHLYFLVVLMTILIFCRTKIMLLIFPILLFLSWFLLEHFNLMDFENNIWTTNEKARYWWSRSDFMYKFTNSYLQEDDKIVEKPIDMVNLADRLADKSIKFIEKAASEKKHFLLFHSFAHVHDPLFTAPRFQGKSKHGKFGDTVMETDDVVGKILDTLKRLKIDQNTFIYLSSDHGGNYPSAGIEGGWNLPYRGGKSIAALEGGIRVPAIIKWPGKIPPGLTINQPTSMMDILPTIKEIIGSTKPNPKPLDGESILYPLKGAKGLYPRTLYHHCGTTLMAIREVTDDDKIYKLTIKEPMLVAEPGNKNISKCQGPFCSCHDKVKYHPKPKLYNIKEDISENNPIDENSKEYKDVAGRLMMKIHEFEANMIASKPLPRQYETYKSVMPRPWLQVYMNKEWKG